MKKIVSETRDEERAFYGSRNISFSNINIEGPADGESAFKECKNIEVLDSHLALRYPFWHDTNAVINNCKLEETARASFWYGRNISLNNVVCNGVKAFRECKDVYIKNSSFESIEFGWQCKNIKIENSSIDGYYAFLHSNNVSLNKVNFKGKYSFQYVKGLFIKDSVLDTKDAFWHSKDVVVENCTVIGEYLAWYAENIHFINCKIKGTQPICYAKKIYFENCTFEDCDLAFEYSEVDGTIKGTLVSIKNPLKGHLVIDTIPEMIVDEHNRSAGDFLIEKRK